MTYIPEKIAASFRDPSGYVYAEGDKIIRVVNERYAPHYMRMRENGFLDTVWEKGWMVRFEEEETPSIPGAWKTLDTERIPFVSFPYEWSFSQLKAAALLTLDIQAEALEHDLILKDASAYNVQFVGARPVFIDILSLEEYREGTPWVAYAQFCRHFLAPLLLMSKVDINAGLMLRNFIDGLPLDMTAAMLPWKTKFSPMIQLHIHLHAKMQKKHADTRDSAEKANKIKISKKTVQDLTQSLRLLVEKLRLPPTSTTWGGLLQRHQLFRGGLYSQARYRGRHAGKAEAVHRAGYGRQYRRIQQPGPQACRYGSGCGHGPPSGGTSLRTFGKE